MSTTTASPPVSAEKASDSGAFTHRQIVTILAGLMLGMFLAALDQTVVSTAIRTIADDLQGYDMQAWATTAFLITSTITTPLYGKLSDLYGRRPFYLFAIGVFVVTAALVGVATLASIVATAGLGLISFVPFVGLTVLPLQLLAWLLRGLVFQYLGLTSAGAYLFLYDAPAEPAEGHDPEVGDRFAAAGRHAVTGDDRCLDRERRAHGIPGVRPHLPAG